MSSQWGKKAFGGYGGWWLTYRTWQLSLLAFLAVCAPNFRLGTRMWHPFKKWPESWKIFGLMKQFANLPQSWEKLPTYLAKTWHFRTTYIIHKKIIVTAMAEFWIWLSALFCYFILKVFSCEKLYKPTEDGFFLPYIVWMQVNLHIVCTY